MHTLIFKNDAVGDLIHSLSAIKIILKKNKNKKITIFLSKLSDKFQFLVKEQNVEIKILNYHLNIIEKVKLLNYIMWEKIDEVYILTPKGFYFYLPLFFRKIRFFAICVNNIRNIKRPSLFLRKFLFKYEVNYRDKKFKRDSITKLQERLVKENNSDEDFDYNFNINTNIKLKKNLPNKYIYFHYKKKICDELGWGLNEISALFEEFGKYYQNIVFTRDISGWEKTRGEEENKNKKIDFEKSFNSYNLLTDKLINRNSKILLVDNVFGMDLVNVINSSQKIVSFHGMMTLIGNVLEKSVLDLWYCKINSWDDYRRYRNSFYEFKPKAVNYDFIIPRKDIKKTIKKINFALKK